MDKYTSRIISTVTSFAGAMLLPWCARKVLKQSENGKSYLLNFNNGEESAAYQVDGKIISAGAKCDRLILVRSNAGDPEATFFVELKGRDIMHAIDQLRQTLRHQLFSPLPTADSCVRARIVTANCGPTSAAKVILERAKVEFRRDFHCDLRVIKSRQPDVI